MEVGIEFQRGERCIRKYESEKGENEREKAKKKETAYASHGRVMVARSANLRRSTGKSGFRKRNAAETYDRAAGRWRV